MSIRTTYLRWVSAACAFLACLVPADAGIPAFPGAAGWGADTPGGRGGRVLFVVNLEDYDPATEKPIPGSLRAACNAKGRRIVVFRVAGTITLKAPLAITEPYITVAGQSAPGGGICLRRHECVIRTHDVVVRYMRFRPGDELGPEYRKRGKPFAPDALLFGEGSRNAVIDHCSASWAIDEVLSISNAGTTEVTVQWCMITESLNNSYHAKGPHGYGSLLRCSGNVTFHHNIYAHHLSRTPRPGTYGDGCITLDFRNNAIYNAIRGGYSAKDPARVNYINNYIKRGPCSLWDCAFQIGGEATQLYVAGNRMAGYARSFEDDWDMIAGAQDVNRREVAFPVAPIPTDSADDAYGKILASCGATLPVRDAVDARIIEEVRTGKGQIIDSQTQVGGWPELSQAPALPDSDRDGMPDTWESRHGLDPTDRLDNNKDIDDDGYTNIEEALNGTDPHRKDVP
jgi:pectate lyase